MFDLEYIEIPVHIGCNLKCKGCSHFSNLLPSTEIVDFLQFKRDINRLKELIPKIDKIRLLGGEPLLNPNLQEFIKVVRDCYSDSYICIVTNGLIIPSLKQEFLEFMHLNDIEFHISLYPPTVTKIDSINEILVQHNIKYRVTEKILSFRKRLNITGNGNAKELFFKCEIGRKCHYLFDGQLSVCPAPILIRDYNRYFGTNINCEEDILFIHRPELSSTDVIKYLKTPMQCCRFCGKSVEFTWTCQNYVPSMYDWIVNG